MSISEIETLRKENVEIMNQFRELILQSKRLVRIVDNLKQENEQLVNIANNLKKDNEELNKENEQLRIEIFNLQNRYKEIEKKITDHQPNCTELVLEHGRNRSVEYLLKRNKTGVRPVSLNECMSERKPKVCMISSSPKSGTWANQYFWSVLDSLCKNAETFDPYDPFFMKLDGIGVDLFIVSHIHSPRYRDYASEEILKKLDAIRYPCARDFDIGNRYMKNNGLDKVCDPFLNENVKIVFTYRNPLDHVVSYARGVWDEKMPQKGPLYDFVHDKEGNYIQINNIKQYIRTGGATTYVYYFMTHQIMKDILGDRLLYMRYEDMLRNRYEKYKELARFFLGSSYDDNMDLKLREALEITKIENMKLLEKASGRAVLHHYSNPAGKSHVRDGSIGRWKDVLDQDDVDYILNLLDDFGISKDYFVFE